jgi:adenylate cyclase
MPTLLVDANAFGPEVRAEAPDGGRLLDLCDEARAPVPFSCRNASCGTCAVEVLEGAALLEPPSEDERFVLGLLGDAPGVRLACVARLRSGDGLVRLRLHALG